MVVRRGVCFLASTLEKPDITVKVDDNVNNEYDHRLTDELVIVLGQSLEMHLFCR